ncbi:hypothetical protein SNE40_008208 [Patella caerulea]|uniref:Kazal-like domain-containing protein n=1 Tax=Patella caerulea TaxID=87958 RepID=A0AAN8JV68_PATCE
MEIVKSVFLPVLVVVLLDVEIVSSFVNVSCPPVNQNAKIHPCTRDLTPVCGSDRVTYANSCEYCRRKWMSNKEGKAWNVYLEHDGACDLSQSPFQPAPTRPTYRPTYGAPTFFQDVVSQYFPASSPSTRFPFNFGNRYSQPGDSFPNTLWQLLNKNIQSPYGSRQQQSQSYYPAQGRPYNLQQSTGRTANCGPYGQKCSRYGRVCGSNGSSYLSECDLCVSAQRLRTTIRIVRDGYC